MAQRKWNRSERGMNRLEIAIEDITNVALDLYLGDVSTEDMRLHIEEIIKKSICRTPQGQLKDKILKVLREA